MGYRLIQDPIYSNRIYSTKTIERFLLEPSFRYKHKYPTLHTDLKLNKNLNSWCFPYSTNVLPTVFISLWWNFHFSCALVKILGILLDCSLHQIFLNPTVNLTGFYFRFYLKLCVFCGYVHVSTMSKKARRGLWIQLELEAVSHMTWVLGAKLLCS